MTVYTPTAFSPSAWPEPMESVYQWLPAAGVAPGGARRGDLSLADRLFASAVVAIRRSERYGAVTWIVSALATSRQTIYDIAAATQRRLMTSPASAGSAAVVPSPAPRVSDNNLARAALTLLLPGGVTLRPMGVCLAELLGEGRLAPWRSTFFNQAGRRAGQVLDQADWSAVAAVIATRDEKFFDQRASVLHRMASRSPTTEAATGVSPLLRASFSR